ncbi:YdeI/OmpD-associated family protein [Leucobacter salsicius]|uniref:YdeI/OmpD-associated family protein n=1 Tax=Leucobacter salsicius TaxID=664638 RepID=UPI000476972C|nr:YdeI/OmpD-associated family protein [Leucobacter salsicius]
MPDTLFFGDSDDFSDWLETHHNHTTEAWLLFHKKGSGMVTQTWSEAVDVALCFGWIDGLRQRVDSDSYRVRFTPRKRSSVLSSVNVEKVEALMRLGKMRPEGIELFNSRKDPQGYSSETRNVDLHPAYEQKFKEHQQAWDSFSRFAPSYRRDAVWWVMSAKREETRLKRLDLLISSSAQEQRVPVFRAKSGPIS